MKNKTYKNTVDELIALKKENNPWMNSMEFDDKGNIKRTIYNVMEFLEKHPKYKDKLRYNVFTQEEEKDGSPLKDKDVKYIYADIDSSLGFMIQNIIDVSLSNVLHNHEYNPVIDYLNSLTWDGVSRIETIFNQLFDVEDTELNRVISKKWFIAAVKRAFLPGSKFDNMLVLQGGQGIGKSTFCEKVSNGLFSNISLDDIGSGTDTKDLVDKLNKTWIAIVDELEGFGKKDMQKIKSFLSLTEDKTRLAYGRRSERFQRHCVFIGSTNDETFLRDNTSSIERRFWILKCRRDNMTSVVYDVMTKEMVDQLWAEAVHYYTTQPDQYLDIESKYFSVFEEQQSQFKTYQTDDYTYWANDILSRDYILSDKGRFRDYTDFVNQVNGYNQTPNNHTGKINKIPAPWLTQILFDKFNIKVSAKTLSLSLSKEWDFKNSTYFSEGKCTRLFERKNKEEIKLTDTTSVDSFLKLT